MHQSVDFHSLFSQLQTRYPMSSLVTECVQCQAQQFVVRALVQIQGAAIASGMAAATTIEQAEDQARLRVLAVLGIVPLTKPPIADSAIGATADAVMPSSFAAVPPPPTWLEPQTENQKSSMAQPQTQAGIISSIEPPVVSHATADFAEASLPLATPEVLLPLEGGQPTEWPSVLPEESGLPAVVLEPDISQRSQADIEPLFAADVPEADSDRTVSSRAPKPKKSSKGTLSSVAIAQSHAEPEPAMEPTLQEPDDLSSLIALTDIEMDRIGWTKQQGRDYLKQTYNKSTRQRLDVGELMDFLHYLRALPSLHGGL